MSAIISSKTGRWINIRDPAAHICPALPVNMPLTVTPLAAFCRSASAKTIFGDFPPNSNVSGFGLEAVDSAMALAVFIEPVKLTLLTPLWLTKASPISEPYPLITFSTPGGRISWMISPNLIEETAASSDGLIITVFPAANA